MCGLVGAVGQLVTDDRKALWKLLQLDTVRGPHSTGVFTRKYNFGKNKKGKNKVDTYYLNKSLGTPWDWIVDHGDDFVRGLPQVDSHVYIGHNRWATKGAINEDNAHPFKQGNLVGVHNGTLTARSINKLDDHTEFETDSECVYHNISENGLEETYSRLEGAWVLIWHDLAKNETYIIKNNQRPLWLAHTQDEKRLFWASEKWMLDVAFAQNKIKTKDYFELDDHTLYTLKTERFGKATIEKGERFRPLPPLAHTYTPPYKPAYRSGQHLPFDRDAKKSKDPVVQNMGIRDAWEACKGKRLPFFIDGSKTKNGEIFYGEALTKDWIVRLDMTKHKTVAKYLDDWGEETWYLGDVSLISHTPQGKVIVTIKPWSMSEPLDYLGQDRAGRTVPYWDGDYDFIDFCTDQAIVGINTYVNWFNALSEDDQIKELESKHTVFENLKGQEEDENKLYKVGNNMVDRSRAEEVLGAGCGMCSEIVDIKDIDKVEWAFGTEHYLCPKCSLKGQIDMMIG